MNCFGRWGFKITIPDFFRDLRTDSAREQKKLDINRKGRQK